MNNEEIEILESKIKGGKRPYVIAIVMALLLVITITATSYAYFVANVSGTSNETVVTTTALEIEFTDGPQVSLENAIPGSYIEKTFKVENKGSGDTTYDVYMSDLINDFADKSDLVYTLTSNDGGYNVSSETQVPDTSSKIVNTHLIRAGEAHNYTLRIEFKETNDNQDDNKGKTFSTIIRVNEVHDAIPSAVDTIKSLVVDADPTSIDEIGTTGLAYDGTIDNNLRYIGANPNNYILFNDELWRIIGVMNNIETESGQTQSLLKIRRTESLGNYSWDSSASSVNAGYGVNEWSQADLMQELNNDYLGNVRVGTDGKWFNGTNNQKTADMPTSTISNVAQGMIENVVWKLGSPSNNNGTYDSNWSNTTSGVTASTSYTRERANTNGKVCSSGTNCNDTVDRTSTWPGKVALFYPSDYLYATSGGTTNNRQSCLNTPMYHWYNVSDCFNNDWLFDSNYYQWTLSPYADSSYVDSVFSVRNDGEVDDNGADEASEVRPVVFLKSNVLITGGSGTQVDPYRLSM